MGAMKWSLRGGILLLGSLLGWSGCTPSSQERTVDLTVPVTVQAAELGTIEDLVEATGTLRPLQAAELVTEVRGQFFFAKTKTGGRLGDGSRVEKGQPVFELANEEFVVGARLKSRSLARDNARKTLEEQEILLERGLVIEKDVETARQTVVDAEAEYEDALIQLAKTSARAPIAGYLSEWADITEGTLVEQGVTVGRIVEYSQVLVDLEIPNAQIRAVELGQAVRVVNYAFAEKVFMGRITAVDPVLDPTTRTFQVAAAVDNSDLLLRPGMFVKAQIVTQERKGVILVPRQLVLHRQNRKVVFVEANARAQMREVETGLEAAAVVEIVSGLEEGDRLITSNYETLRGRTRVRVTQDGR